MSNPFPQSTIPNRAPIVKRDRVSIYVDDAEDGSSQPDYSLLICKDVPAEILQVSGNEFVRGKQVEAIVSFVVSVRDNPLIRLNARCKLVILSGVYKDQEIFLHRIHYETEHGRPVQLQLHCKNSE